MARSVRQHCAHFLSHVTPLRSVMPLANPINAQRPGNVWQANFTVPLFRAQERGAMITDKLGAVSTLPGALRQLGPDN